MCDRTGAFEPSYPIEEMSTSQFQRAALGPLLWQGQLVREESHEVSSFITIPSLQHANEPNPFTAAFLIPGGRYLFAQTQDQLASYDLQSEEFRSTNNPSPTS